MLFNTSYIYIRLAFFFKVLSDYLTFGFSMCVSGGECVLEMPGVLVYPTAQSRFSNLYTNPISPCVKTTACVAHTSKNTRAQTHTLKYTNKYKAIQILFGIFSIGLKQNIY